MVAGSHVCEPSRLSTSVYESACAASLRSCSARVHGAALLGQPRAPRDAHEDRAAPQRDAATPPDPEAIAEYAGVAVARGAAWSTVFSAEDAAQPFLTEHEGMWSFFEPQLQTRLAGLTADAPEPERVKATLRALLPAGDGSMRSVARRLGIGSRTLQRRLHREGETYPSVLSKVRESLARHYLRRSDLSAAELSYLLGYQDPNSFYRAFSGSTGTTPEALRSASA